MALRELYVDGGYLQRHPDWHREDAPWKAAHIVEILQRNGLHPQTLCEVGCGAGAIVQEVAHRLDGRVQIDGYEVAPQAFELCRAHAPDPAISYHLGNPFDDGQTWDVALAIDVFEHVDDYLGFLAKMRRLAPVCVFHIPLDVYALGVLHAHGLLSARNGNGHLHHFTAETALDTLKYAGFRVRDSMYTPAFQRAPKTGFRNRLAYTLRSAAFSANPAVTARVLGGVSLMVLADSDA